MGSAFASEPGEDDGFEGGLEQELGLGQGVIELGAIFKIGFGERVVSGDGLRGFAAIHSQRLELAGQAGSASDGQGSFVLACSHASNITPLRGESIQPNTELGLSVCLTRLFPLPGCRFGLDSPDSG